jgi:sugar transferase (PEP-CTERM/EpsH1 system associated)
VVTHHEEGPVRVLHLVPVFAVGGMEVGLTKIVNGIDPAAVRGGICSFTPVGDVRERLSSGVPLFELRRRSGNDPRLVTQLYRLLKRERPHIVHTHAWGTLCEGYLAARLAGIPHIVHGEHGTMETRRRNIGIQRFVWRRVDQVLSVSERLADRMAREVGFPRTRIRTIRNGVDLARWATGDRAATRTRLHAGPADVLVLAVGRLVPVKNHANLLTAVARARAAGVPCRLMIAGEGPLRPALEAQAAALGVADAVELPGQRQDLPDLLAACDIFALSSDSEGMSNTIIEAMAAGRPVLATDVGGNSELVVPDRTGLLVEARSPEALAEGIRKLAADPATREAMGAAGRRRAEYEFSLRRMLEEYQSMYLNVAGGPH